MRALSILILAMSSILAIPSIALSAQMNPNPDAETITGDRTTISGYFWSN